jgi:hypothetical protein
MKIKILCIRDVEAVLTTEYRREEQVSTTVNPATVIPNPMGAKPVQRCYGDAYKPTSPTTHDHLLDAAMDVCRAHKIGLRWVRIAQLVIWVLG